MSQRFVRHWIALTLVASVAAALDGGWIARWAALAPARIWHGEVWRLVTWPLVETGVMPLVFTCAAIYKFGGELAERWGDPRLFRFVRHIVLSAAVVTCIVGVIPGLGYVHRLGGWAITDALVIAWARQFSDRTLSLYGLVSFRGKDLVNLTIAIAVLFAIFHGPVATTPELVACAAATLYPRSWLQR
ncbi:MAG TPA: rhomboid family intramembrane serine protease [Kofleriaceae bacterium]|nr:rhomboid family intramembrane serine protease [Kofleriaceae bacterium]